MYIYFYSCMYICVFTYIYFSFFLFISLQRLFGFSPFSRAFPGLLFEGLALSFPVICTVSLFLSSSSFLFFSSFFFYLLIVVCVSLTGWYPISIFNLLFLFLWRPIQLRIPVLFLNGSWEAFFR